jgi:hypothetical protein
MAIWVCVCGPRPPMARCRPTLQQPGRAEAGPMPPYRICPSPIGIGHRRSGRRSASMSTSGGAGLIHLHYNLHVRCVYENPFQECKFVSLLVVAMSVSLQYSLHLYSINSRGNVAAVSSICIAYLFGFIASTSTCPGSSGGTGAIGLWRSAEPNICCKRYYHFWEAG